MCYILLFLVCIFPIICQCSKSSTLRYPLPYTTIPKAWEARKKTVECFAMTQEEADKEFDDSVDYYLEHEADLLEFYSDYIDNDIHVWLLVNSTNVIASSLSYYVLSEVDFPCNLLVRLGNVNYRLPYEDILYDDSA